MEITDTFYPTTRAQWRAWLSEHHEERSEVWLVSYRKAVGKPCVAYNDAVEEALCFGWIDSTRKGMDKGRWAQRFTPRRAGSGFSQTNLERLARMREQGLVAPRVAAEVADLTPESFEVPEYILAALRSDPEAWRHWQSFSPSYQRIRAAYIDGARDRGDAELRKRLDHLLRKTAAGKQFGYGIQTYY